MGRYRPRRTAVLRLRISRRRRGSVARNLGTRCGAMEMDGQEYDAEKAFCPEAAIEIGQRFLGAIYEETDVLLFRPIESCLVDGKKKPRPVYKSTQYPVANRDLLSVVLAN